MKPIKVNTKDIPDELQEFVNDKMTKEEVALLGYVILQQKISRIKQKLFGWLYDRKTKKNNK